MAGPFAESETSATLAGRAEHLLAALDAVIARRGWDRRQIEEFQLHALQRLTAHAFEHVPLYRRKFEAAGFHPRQLQSLADLHLIPLLDKQELRAAATELPSPLAGEGSVRGTARWLCSSGSTGVPAGIYRDEESLWHFTACNMALYYQWCEERPIDRVLYIVDLTPGTIDFALADLLAHHGDRGTAGLGVGAGGGVDRKDFRLRAGVHLLVSFHDRSIAIALDRRGRRYPRLRLLHLTSEMLDGRTRQLLAGVFPQARLVETYTSTEAGLIAYPCPHGGRWHLTEDAAIYEILDPAGQPTEGLGEIVVTDLTNWSSPIIRYRGLGDFCRPAAGPCPCGSPLRAIAHLEGRRADSLFRGDGTAVSPYTVTNLLETIAGIYQFQVLQQAVGQFEVAWCRSRSASQSEEEIDAAIHRAMRAAVHEQPRCHVQFTPQIDPPPGAHKVPLVIPHMARNG